MVKPCLKEAPSEELCGDDVMVTKTLSIGLKDPICTNPSHSMPVSSPLLPTTLSYLHAFHISLGVLEGLTPSFVPYCAYLEDVPRKIM